MKTQNTHQNHACSHYFVSNTVSKDAQITLLKKDNVPGSGAGSESCPDGIALQTIGAHAMHTCNRTLYCTRREERIHT